MIKKSILIWLAILPLAILNGGLREKIIVPLIGEKYALSLSGILLCLLIFILSYLFIHCIGKGNAKNYWRIGFLWMLLTVVIEIIFGLVGGFTFSEMLKGYDITTGNLWLVVVLFTGLSLWLAAKTRKLI